MMIYNNITMINDNDLIPAPQTTTLAISLFIVINVTITIFNLINKIALSNTISLLKKIATATVCKYNIIYNRINVNNN